MKKYSPEHYLKNREAQRAAQKRYYERTREQRLLKQKEYDDKHREEIANRHKEKNHYREKTKIAITS